MPDPRIRIQALEALQLHSEGQHADALNCAMKLARANPDSAPALNLAGALHVHASGGGWKERATGDDDDDDEAASALVLHHRRAAVDAFSAAARIAPSCVMTAVLHAEALVADHRFADALLELARVLWTTTANHDDPAVHHVAYEHDLAGGSSSTAEVRKSDAVYKASVFMEDLAAMINKARVVPRDAAVDQVRQGAEVLSRTYPYSVRPLIAAAAASSEVNPTAEAVKAGPALKFEEQVKFTLPIMTGDSYWDECNCHTVKIFGNAAEVRKKIHDLEHGKSNNLDATLVLWGYLEELLSTAKAIAKTLEKMNLVPYSEPHWFRNRDTGMAVSMDLADWESQVALFLSLEGSALNAPREEGLDEKSESPAVAEVEPVERNLSEEEVLGEQCAPTLPSPGKIAGISFWDGWQRLDSLEEGEGHDEVALVPGVAFWERYQDKSNVAAFTAMLDDDMYMADKKAEWCCGA